MDWVTPLGFAAGIMTTVGYVPQLIKLIRTKSSRDISLLMFLVISIGVFLWLLYGFYIDSLPVIAANAVTLGFTAVISFLKIRYSRRR